MNSNQKKSQVTSENEIKAAFETLRENFGRVDVIVNCAGILIPGKLYDTVKNEMQSLKEIEDTVNVVLLFLIILSPIFSAMIYSLFLAMNSFFYCIKLRNYQVYQIITKTKYYFFSEINLNFIISIIFWNRSFKIFSLKK